jgi:sugar/nucleoside kinase (ribokinase family)
MTRVYCIGNIVADIQVKTLEALPPVDQIQPVEAIEFVLGGNAANTAACLALVGVPSAVIARVGDDPFGGLLLGGLRAAGVDISHALVTPGERSSVTMCPVGPRGERRSVFAEGATRRFTAADVPWDVMAGNAHLHICSFFLLTGFGGVAAASVLQRARDRRMSTSLDVCWDPFGRWAGELAPCFEHLDFILPNRSEAEQITGLADPAEMGEWFLDRGVKTAIVKLGTDGCLVKTRGDTMAIPAYPAQALDTTGAGDAFAAGFLAGQVWGWDVRRSAQFGAALAAVSVTGYGASSAVKSRAQVLQVMEAESSRSG